VSVRLADCGVTLRGDAARAAFSAWARAWEKDAEAHESRFSIERVSALSSDSVSVNYSARWLTPGVLPFVRLARAWPGGLRLSFVDLRPLAGRRSTFTWGALARKLAGALASGTLELPQATVGGRLVLTFDANGLVQSVEESLDLAPDLRAGRVLNRRGASPRPARSDALLTTRSPVARDLADYLAEWRRPPTTSAAAWDDVLRDALELGSVPGMRALDVDGLEPAQLSGRLEASAFLMGATAIALIVFGVSAAQLHAKQPRLLSSGGDAEDAGSRLRSRRSLLRAQGP